MKNALRFLSKDQSSKIKTGLYRHYKGKTYYVEGSAKHSETLEDMVIYQAMYKDPQFGDFAMWIRPLSMFLEAVNVDGYSVQRFTAMTDEETALFERNLFLMMRAQ